MAKTGGGSEGDRQEPTLELPSLFGRGRKRRGEEPKKAADREAPTGPVAPRDQPTFEADVRPRPVQEPHPEPEPAAAPEPRRRADRPRRSAPTLAAPVAAAGTGIVVGLLGTGLTAAGLRGCEAARGTDSCGGPGLGLLVVIVAVMVLAGAVLLKLLGVSEHRGTSFLGTGLMCVVALLALTDHLFSVWMFLVVPLICAAAFPVAHWVTTRFVEIDADDRPHVDVR